MITLRVWFLAIATAALVAGSAWTPVPKQSPVRVTDQTPTVMDGLDLLEQAGLPHFDLYGNEIEDAVTDYRLEQGGAVYESHSPDTEVPRLGPPVS